MSGVYKSIQVPLLQIEGQEAVNSKDKTEMLVKTFEESHSSKNFLFIGRTYASYHKRERYGTW